MNTKTDLLLDQQELQHLITVSTGSIDVYKISCFNQFPMLLPQNIILSAQTANASVKKFQWHDAILPVYAINDPKLEKAVALIVEGETEDQRFVLLCDEMPETLRLRISELVDDTKQVDSEHIFQYVSMQNQIYQIPALDQIYNSIKR